ncbi:iron chelate uptake ABC transporter family permease subunit [Shigella flexneri]
MLEAFSGTASADCTIAPTRGCRVPLPVYWQAARLALPGALMQTLTRKPTCAPGLLGVNAGASFAIVLGAALFGYSSAQEQLAMAFAGRWWPHRSLPLPAVRWRAVKSGAFNLAGVALAAVLEGLTSRHRPALKLTSTINRVSGKPFAWIFAITQPQKWC